MTEERSPHAQIVYDLLNQLSTTARPQLSPDGRRVAHLVATIDVDKNTTVARIWLDGSPVTAGPSDSCPVWSPDGRWLAFTSRRSENGKDATLHVMPVDGPGEVRTVCQMPDGISSVTWSPDGRWMAFISRTQDPRYQAPDVRSQTPRKVERFFSRSNGEDWVFDRPEHVYVVAADGTKAPRNLTPGEFYHQTPVWLADSSGVIASAARHDTWDRDLARDLYRIDLDGTITALTDSTREVSLPAVSPDGTKIAFIGDDDPLTYPFNAKVGVMNLDGSDRRWISTGLDRTFFALSAPQAPVWLDDSTLVAVAEDRGDVHLYRLTVDGDAPEQITEGPVTVTGYDAANGEIVATISDVTHPPEVWTGIGTSPKRLTHITSDHLGWEKFAVPCTDGSDEIDAWIMRPADFDPEQRYPVLLNVHGGPFTQYGEVFFDEAQMQAQAGFVVIMSNPRGASGRHTAWGQAIMGPKHPVAPGTGWGGVDVDDIMAVLDTTLERYEFCDPDRVGMLGGSYGGYMATLLATRFSDRFKAICSERAVNNLLTEEWSSDIGTAFRMEHGVDPVEDPAEYLRMSPVMMARDIDVPMLLIHSEEGHLLPLPR